MLKVYSRSPRFHPSPISPVSDFPKENAAERIWASEKEFVFSSPVAPATQKLTSQFLSRTAGVRSCALSGPDSSTRTTPTENGTRVFRASLGSLGSGMGRESMFLVLM